MRALRRAKDCSLRLTLGLFLACIALVIPAPSFAQRSYRTQQSFRSHPASQQPQHAQRARTSTGSNAAVSKKARRFLGWRQSANQGPEVTRYFQRLQQRPSAAARVLPGFEPTVPRLEETPQSPRFASPAATAPASTTFPGIQLRPSFPAGGLPSGVVTGDFNGDGKLDWVVSNAGDNSLCIYLGNGDGTSKLPVIIPLVGQSPVGIAAADLNGDGKLDLAVAEADSNTVGILFGNGDGTFQPEKEIAIANAQPLGVAIADLTNNGHSDVLVAMQGSGPNLQSNFEVMLGDGAGNFGAPIYAPPVITPDGPGEGLTFSVADINGDGIPDLVVIGLDGHGSNAKSYFGKGDGSFTAGSEIWTSEIGLGVAALADLNGDGCPDLVLTLAEQQVDILYNDCQGNFPTSNLAAYGMGDAFGLVVADVNGDGHPDILTGGVPVDTAGFGSDAGDSLTVRLNDGTGKFGPAQVFRGDPGMFAITVADLSGNGFPDVVTANQNGSSVSVYTNNLRLAIRTWTSRFRPLFRRVSYPSRCLSRWPPLTRWTIGSRSPRSKEPLPPSRTITHSRPG